VDFFARFQHAKSSLGAPGSKNQYGLDPVDMKNDLTGNRPIYPLSCYGPGKDAPRQLIEGPVEISPEELRVRYYAQRLSGNEAGAVSIP
jgi:nucleoporin NUP42